MERKVPISDATISRNVSRQLATSGLRSPCHVQVQTRNGEVTLSGTVQFVHQRNTAVQAIRTVEGVTRVVEKLKVTPPPKHQYPQPTATSKKPGGDESQVQESLVDKGDALAEPTLPPAPVSRKDAPPAPDAVIASPSIVPVQVAAALPVTRESGPEASAARPAVGVSDLRYTRTGDSYTFECSSSDEAERLRVLLASFSDWLKKNCWVGSAKQTGDLHRVTFHAKSLIEFLRQQEF